MSLSRLLLPACLAVLNAACATPSAPSAPSAPSTPPAGSAPPAQPPSAGIAAVAPPDSAVLGVWVVEQARSAPLLDKRLARLSFEPDGTVSGNASCNSFRGRFTLAGDSLKMAPLVTTRMACAEAQMEQEDRVLTALERAARAVVPPHGFLTLFDADGAVLMRASRFSPPAR